MITEGQVLDIAKDAIYYIIICSAPVLIISLVVGLIISIFQTVTSIQEQTSYICTKDCGSIYWIDGMWFVDSESAVGICDDLMVELQYLFLDRFDIWCSIHFHWKNFEIFYLNTCSRIPALYTLHLFMGCRMCRIR